MAVWFFPKVMCMLFPTVKHKPPSQIIPEREDASQTAFFLREELKERTFPEP